MWAKVGNTLIHLAYVRYIEYIPASIGDEDDEDEEDDVDSEDEESYEEDEDEEEDELTISFNENPTENTVLLTFHGSEAKDGFEKISKLIENAV